MADDTTTRPNAAAQFETGYVLNDDRHFALCDLSRAMRFSAELVEQQDEMDDEAKGAIDVTTMEVAALIRTFARVIELVAIDVPYSFAAPIRRQGAQQ